MHLIGCIAKLQNEMGLKKTDLSHKDDRTGIPGQWHANLLFIDRKKCILFVNDRILTIFLVPDLSRTEICNLGFILWVAWFGFIWRRVVQDLDGKVFYFHDEVQNEGPNPLSVQIIRNRL